MQCAQAAAAGSPAGALGASCASCWQSSKIEIPTSARAGSVRPKAINSVCAATAKAATVPINGRQKRLELPQTPPMLIMSGPDQHNAIIRTGESKVNARATRRQHQRRGATSAAASLRPHAHKSLAAAFGDQLVVLVVGAVVEFDDAGARPRFRFALAEDLGGRVHGVALEQRVRELHLG